MKTLMIYITCLMIPCPLLAFTNYIGYSGAPASNGTCTRSCHIQNSFSPSCQVTGFPEIYIPGQQYLISVHHNGEQPINQFNCSIRNNSDSTIAGTVSADENTSIYNTTNETNGVHWSTADTDSGTFIWTAPEPGVGDVTLYWSGLQGSRANGADQQIVLQASQQSSEIIYVPELPEKISLNQNYPNPFNNATTIPFEISRRCNIVLEISNLLGQLVRIFTISDAQPGCYVINWDGRDTKGNYITSGLYFYQLRTPDGNLTRKMTILR